MVLGLILQTYVVFATSETKYLQFEADTKIEIIGEPKLGEPFEVIFTFKLLEDILHTQGVLDNAYLTSEQGVKFLDGDTVWNGLLQKGQKYSLRARYVVDTTVAFRFRGIVYAKEVPGKIPPPDPVRDSVKVVGVKCVNGAVSRLIDFRTEDQKRHQLKIPRLMMTDTGLVLIGSAMVAPPKEIMVVNPDIEMVTNDRPPKKDKLRTWEEAIQQMHRKGDLPIKLDSLTPDTIRITYDSGRAYVFVTDTSVKSIEVELLDGKAAYEKIEEKKGAFRLESDSAVFRISTDKLEKVLIVKLAEYNNRSKERTE